MPAQAQPKDRTRREHLAKVDRVIWADDAQPFVILALNDGLTAAGPAAASQFEPGVQYRFLGRWADDARRGPRFNFSTFVVHQVVGRDAVLRYLARTCPTLTPAEGGRLYHLFGGNCVNLLQTELQQCLNALPKAEPARVREASERLKHDAATAYTKLELHELLAGKGFHGKLIDQAVAKWGVRAAAVARRNPFALLGLAGAGFKRCDRLWADLGLPKDSLKRQAVCLWDAARTDTAGHTWLSAERLATVLTEQIPTASVVKAMKLALRTRKLKKHRDADGKLWLTEYDKALAEERVADAVKRLSAGPPLWPADAVPVSQADGDGLPSAHQAGRLKLATAGPVGLFLGGPGTGKTHTLAYLLREVIAEFGRSAVAVCAPTGKAAVRAKQALALAGLDLDAQTIHRTLEVTRNGHDGAGWGFGHGRGNPLPARFLVVDESSMIDAGLMADLLDACGDGTQVLFVGDPHQLPPVGHGSPLRDLIAAGVPHGELTEVRRNAGQIVHACVRVKNGEEFEAADAIDLDCTPPKNLKLIEPKSLDDAADLLLDLVRAVRRFDPVWQTQVIVARNTAGPVSRVELNRRLHPVLNPDGVAAKDNPFKVGDKIICLKNSRMHRVEPVGEFGAAGMATDPGYYQEVKVPGEDGRPGEVEEVFVANGEIGRVVAVAPRLTIARFSEGDALVKIPMGKQRDEDGPEDDKAAEQGRGCNFDHGYAITVHKAQGSESPCVIVVGDDQAVSLTSREWLYTAISRASKLCILLGKKSSFLKMAARQSLVKRKTFLAERIAEAKGG